MAARYHCRLLDVNRTVAVLWLAAEDDAGALLEADKILAASNCTTAEIWDGKRKVSLLSRKVPGT